MTEENKGFDRLMEIMRKLRAPGGCPWDAEQSHESLKRYLIEEAYEVIEAIDKNDPELLKEELGDLLLQPVFHAAIAEENGSFTMDEVLAAINAKLVRRHPHVFGEERVKTAAEQVENWERIKKGEKGEERTSALSGVPPHMPALMKAQKITEKAARVGFDWEHVDQVFAKVLEELHELEETTVAGTRRGWRRNWGTSCSPSSTSAASSPSTRNRRSVRPSPVFRSASPTSKGLSMR